MSARLHNASNLQSICVSISVQKSPTNKFSGPVSREQQA